MEWHHYLYWVEEDPSRFFKGYLLDLIQLEVYFGPRHWEFKNIIE